MGHGTKVRVFSHPDLGYLALVTMYLSVSTLVTSILVAFVERSLNITQGFARGFLDGKNAALPLRSFSFVKKSRQGRAFNATTQDRFLDSFIGAVGAPVLGQNARLAEMHSILENVAYFSRNSWTSCMA